MAEWREELAALLGPRFSTAAAIRQAHGGGEGLRDAVLPDAVAFAHATEEVAAIMRVCAGAGVPVIPFGTGTSLEGHLQALRGGLSLDLSGMDRILAVNAADMDCRVEAGVTREALNAHLRDMGLFFPPDPGANASIGGMAATRASGTNAVRYGTMRELVLGLEVVLADGRIIRTGGRARKSSAGYDLTRLFVGSEGTLGIITQVQLRLAAIPEAVRAATVQFPTLDGAVACVMDVMQAGIAMARIELLDALQMEACIRWSRLEALAPLPSLFLEFHGSDAGVAEQVAAVAAIAAAHGGQGWAFAESAEARSRLWKARHDAYHAARALAPGKDSLTTDACVPISRLADCINACRADAEALQLVAPIVGHVGDGNFHMLVLCDPADPDERARAEALCARVAVHALACGGTITGEHGIGVHKLAAMRAEHDEGALAVMRAIKAALDPAGLLNPGKTVPAA